MTLRDLIERTLADTFAPDLLEVIDESDRHRGHAGWREGGETHFRVRLVSAGFSGLGRVARHRAVNACLAEAFARGLHALAIEARAPGEPDPRGGDRAADPA